MKMEPGCVVYNPAENHWCVLVEHRREDGEVRRFMSFHKNRLEAQEIKKAHEEAHADDLDTTVSMFEYDYIPNDRQEYWRSSSGRIYPQTHTINCPNNPANRRKNNG
ncbi:MAG: hypothetical protein HXO60_06975 [Rothia mucilaginosa]|uniref:hypothetical protein n=1 Tax=Rothia mucilaginosa TaxID=43675 RepID=UPI001CACDE85|nr:hypothetical protein [Rothia mucilaginosa]MBF1652226.1 hypothetical protein [Rothia mucilaginosa]